MSSTIDIVTTMAQINCGLCGGVYCITERYRDDAYRKGSCWNCPYCKCSWGYSGVGREETLKKQLAAAEQKAREAAWAREHAESVAAKAQGKAKRVEAEMKRQKIRIHNGVCPCCNRTFVKLGQHMAMKHPEYLK